MASTVTSHSNSAGQVYSLAAGNNKWSDLLAASGPAGLALGHASFSFRVESGGPVAFAKKAMAAATDGAQYNIGEGDTEDAAQGQIVDGSQINFWDDGGGGAKIFVRAHNR